MLYQYRDQVLNLDSVQSLTQGSPVSPAGLLAGLHPARGSFTGVGSPANGAPTLVGQMCYTLGERSAHLRYVAPAKASTSPELVELLESLIQHAGEWGAFSLLAEVEEYDPIFENLRRAGFSVYGWQRIWRAKAQPTAESTGESRWKAITSLDQVAVRSLYQQVVPPMVQSAEPPPERGLQGVLCRSADETLAYVAHSRGPRGLYLQPVIHPSVGNVPEMLQELLSFFAPLAGGRPVYLAVRHYQSWLESALEELGVWQAAPRQALFARHLVNFKRVPAFNKTVNVLEKKQAEPTAPFANHAMRSQPDAEAIGQNK